MFSESFPWCIQIDACATLFPEKQIYAWIPSKVSEQRRGASGGEQIFPGLFCSISDWYRIIPLSLAFTSHHRRHAGRRLCQGSIIIFQKFSVMPSDWCLCNSFSGETNLCLDFVQGFRKEKGSIWRRTNLSRTCAKFAFQIEIEYSPFLSLSLPLTRHHRPGRNKIWRNDSPHVRCVITSYHGSVYSNG